MNMESLEDDNFEEFKGGTLEIKQENTSIRLSCSSTSKTNSPDSSISINSNLNENVLNTNLNETTGNIWRGSNLINIPKRITETLWSCKNNNNLAQTQSQAVANFSGAIASNENVQDYFTFRDEVVEKAVIDCVESLIHSNDDDDGELIGTFLLTEITTWDAEKERLVILSERALYSVKYDFIALKKLEHKRVALNTLNSIFIGDLVYPSTSLVPRLNGLASGVSNVMKGCLIDRWSQQQNSNQTNQQQRFFDTTNLFQPRDRKTHGIRIHWNCDAPIAFTQRWNPFNSDVPFITFTSHPLNRHADSLNDNQRSTFSVDEFSKKLINAIENENEKNCMNDTKSKSKNKNKNENECLIQHKDILLQTYVGLGSLIYNRNALGFFKVRGKFSF